MIGMDLGIRCDFVRENTRQQRPAIVPELVLYLAGGAAPIWGLTKEELDTLGLPPPYWSYGWAGGQGLARYMLDHPHVVAGKRVVDFSPPDPASLRSPRRGLARRLCWRPTSIRSARRRPA